MTNEAYSEVAMDEQRAVIADKHTAAANTCKHAKSPSVQHDSSDYDA
jgi:hypothetical protein